jgi:hypothetical protein
VSHETRHREALSALRAAQKQSDIELFDVLARRLMLLRTARKRIASYAQTVAETHHVRESCLVYLDTEIEVSSATTRHSSFHPAVFHTQLVNDVVIFCRALSTRLLILKKSMG